MSIPSNVAEGHGRSSNFDRVHFLHIARGSLFELDTQLVIAADLGFVEVDDVRAIQDRLQLVIDLLNGLIRYYVRIARKRPTTPQRHNPTTSNKQPEGG